MWAGMSGVSQGASVVWCCCQSQRKQRDHAGFVLTHDPPGVLHACTMHARPHGCSACICIWSTPSCTRRVQLTYLPLPASPHPRPSSRMPPVLCMPVSVNACCRILESALGYTIAPGAVIRVRTMEELQRVVGYAAKGVGKYVHSRCACRCAMLASTRRRGGGGASGLLGQPKSPVTPVTVCRAVW